MIHHAATILPYLWHPLGACPAGSSYEQCRSYNFWSGIEGNVQLIVSLLAGLLIVWRFWRKTLRPHLECHTDCCHALGLHPVAGTHFRTCWHHHPVLGEHPHRSVPLHIIHQHHKEAQKGISVTDSD